MQIDCVGPLAKSKYGSVYLFSDENNSFDPTEQGRFFSVAMAALTKKKKKSFKMLTPGKRRWLNAVKLIKHRGDPWEKFNIDKIKTQRGRRHR